MSRKEVRKRLEASPVGRFVLFWLLVARDAYTLVRYGAALFFIRRLPATTLCNLIKRGCLRLTGAKTGHHLNIEEDVTIRAPWRLSLGSYTTVGKGVVITCAGGVTIEDCALVGYGTKIISANHTIPDDGGLIRFAGHTLDPVRIGRGAWIGANCVILPGVTVGEGAVVAAGATVTKDVSPYTIVGGVPAKQIRERLRQSEGQNRDPGEAKEAK